MNLFFHSEEEYKLPEYLISFRDNAYEALMKSIDMQSVIKLSKTELHIEIEMTVFPAVRQYRGSGEVFRRKTPLFDKLLSQSEIV